MQGNGVIICTHCGSLTHFLGYSQPHAPSVPPLRDVITLSTWHLDAFPSLYIPPQAMPTFLLMPKGPSLVEVAAVSPAQVHASQQHAPSSLPSRDGFLPRIPTQASPIPLKHVPRTVETFPATQADIQADPVPKIPRSSYPADARLVQSPYNIPLPQTPAETSIPSAPVVPTPFPRLL